MWISILDEDISTKHGETYMLFLKHKTYFGHKPADKEYETVFAIWDNVEECFHEKDTGLEVDAAEIYEWWKDI